MAKSYSPLTDTVSLIFTVLLVSGLWEYVDWIAEMLTTYVLPFLGFCIVVYFLRKILRLRQGRNPRLTTIDAMSGVEFEQCVARLLRARGFSNVKLTEKYDYGIDVIADKHGTRWGIQVKRCSGLVKSIAVRQAVTALRKYGCTRAMVISNAYYSNFAVELAKSNHCVLVNRKELSTWL